MRPPLFTDPTPPPAGPAPDDATPLPSATRRGLAASAAGLWHGDHRVSLDTRHPGAALDALLGLTRPGSFRHLPPSARAALVAALTPLATGASTGGATLRDLQLDGLRAAAAAALRALGAEVAPPDGALPLVRALLAPSGHDDEAMAEWAEWVTSADPVYAVQEDRYAYTDEDLGLLWCGLARAATSRGFPWLRSGLIILHECSPDGARISANARDALRELLALQRAPTDYDTWQDQVCAVLDDLRARDRRALAPPAPTATAGPVELSLSAAQRQWLDAHDLDGVLDALDEVSGWFPDARAAGAVPSTAWRALQRAASRGAPLDEALAAERVLGAALEETVRGLGAGVWRGVPVGDGLVEPLTVLLHHRVDHPDDLDALTEALGARGDLRSPRAADALLEALYAFADGWAPDAAPWWRMLRRQLAGATWSHGDAPVHPARLADALGPDASLGDLDRLLRLDQLADLASLGLGLAPAVAGRRDAAATATDAVTAARAITVRSGGAWFLDTSGRAESLIPGPTRVAATIAPDGSVRVTAVEGSPTAVPLARGDLVRLPDGREATLAEVRGRSAKVHLVEDGYARIREASADELAPVTPAVVHRWQLRGRLAAARRRAAVRVAAP